MTDTDINDAVQTALERFDENLVDLLAENIEQTCESIFNDAKLEQLGYDACIAFYVCRHDFYMLALAQFYRECMLEGGGMVTAVEAIQSGMADAAPVIEQVLTSTSRKDWPKSILWPANDLLRAIKDEAPRWYWVEHERQRVIQDALDGEPERSERAIARMEDKL